MRLTESVFDSIDFVVSDSSGFQKKMVDVKKYVYAISIGIFSVNLWE